mmetsp:Transcript_3251/g.8078  ORF Transcript_3251/g.8078 Transcript_3251/m.8078 type:complete len:144 (-) Transcript_3251:228-659(-)
MAAPIMMDAAARRPLPMVAAPIVMDAGLVAFIDEATNSPYEATRVADALLRCAATDMAKLTAMDVGAIEAAIRQQELVDEMWVSTHALRIFEAARIEVSRAKAPRRVPTSQCGRGKAGIGHSEDGEEEMMDAVEEEVKRMRLQ